MTLALERMRSIDGWMEQDEGKLLASTAVRALREFGCGDRVTAFVEVGSYLGKSTVILGTVATYLAAQGTACRVYAIDPHEGEVTLPTSNERRRLGPTYDAFRRNLEEVGLDEVVVALRSRSLDVEWHEPIALLFLDGLHDYESVRTDFEHFQTWLPAGAYAVFHDRDKYFPGVVRFTSELVGSGSYAEVAAAGSLAVLRRRAQPA